MLRSSSVLERIDRYGTTYHNDLQSRIGYQRLYYIMYKANYSSSNSFFNIPTR